MTGIEVWARHGVLPHERELGQRFLVDATIELDLRAAAHSDALEDTVDYGQLASELHHVASAETYQLLESLAERLLEVCLVDPRVTAAEVTVHKPAAPLAVPAAEVSVTRHRTR